MPTTDLSMAPQTSPAAQRGAAAEPCAETDRRLSSLLLRLATEAPVSGAELTLLAAGGEVQAAFAPATPAEAVLGEATELLPRVWPPFEAWWRSYFASEAPICELWRLYLPFAQ